MVKRPVGQDENIYAILNGLIGGVAETFQRTLQPRLTIGHPKQDGQGRYFEPRAVELAQLLKFPVTQNGVL
jgi:hypothetical protein